MNPIELIAFDYLLFAQGKESYAYLIIIIFATLIGLLNKVDFRMQRGTMFLNVALVFLGSTLLGTLFWSLVPSAIASGYLFLLVTIEIFIFAIVAYAFIIIGKARSNDICGHSNYVAFILIPFAYIWLQFTPSKDKMIVEIPAFLNGVKAVFIAFIVYAIAIGHSLDIEQSAQSFSDKIDSKTQELIRIKYFEYYAKRKGIEYALEYYKTLDKELIGKEIDKIIVTDIDTEKNQLTYTLKVNNNEITGFTHTKEHIWTQNICDTYSGIWQLGAKVTWHFYNEKVPTLAYVSADTKTCGKISTP
jgi:hypothetical protein